MGAGKTYSRCPASPGPAGTKLAALVSTIFKGESLRGMLLNAYGRWKASQIMYIAALTPPALPAPTRRRPTRRYRHEDAERDRQRRAPTRRV